jgi:hypothetical protein
MCAAESSEDKRKGREQQPCWQRSSRKGSAAAIPAGTDQGSRNLPTPHRTAADEWQARKIRIDPLFRPPPIRPPAALGRLARKKEAEEEKTATP